MTANADPQPLTDGQEWALTWLDRVTDGYIEAMLDSESDEDSDRPLSRKYDERDLHPSATAAARATVRAFLLAAGDALLADTDVGSAEMKLCGYLLYHESGGNGVGFWDGRWPEGSADACSEVATAAGQKWWYVAGGQVFQMGAEPDGPCVMRGARSNKSFHGYWAERPRVARSWDSLLDADAWTPSKRAARSRVAGGHKRGARPLACWSHRWDERPLVEVSA